MDLALLRNSIVWRPGLYLTPQRKTWSRTKPRLSTCIHTKPRNKETQHYSFSSWSNTSSVLPPSPLFVSSSFLLPIPLVIINHTTTRTRVQHLVPNKIYPYTPCNNPHARTYDGKWETGEKKNKKRHLSSLPLPPLEVSKLSMTHAFSFSLRLAATSLRQLAKNDNAAH